MANSDDADEDKNAKGTYDVGYGRPPKATRFAPGRSGNPRGRPKAPKTFAEEIDKRLSTKVPVMENGRRKLISFREVIVAKTVNKAAEGDHKFISLLLKAQVDQSLRTDGGSTEEHDHDAEEALLRQIISSMGVPLDVLLNLPPEADHDET